MSVDISMYADSMPRKDPIYFSLGYRCSSAGLLKQMGLKHESYPFDWMVSRLPILRDCIYNGFDKFMDPANYARAVAATWHYVAGASGDTEYIRRQQYICEEKFVYNTYYETMYSGRTKELLVPYPVSVPRDAYGYNLIMNHKNVVDDDASRDYYQRCVLRWNMLMASSCEKIGVYIHPLMSYESYNKDHFRLREMITEFHSEIGEATGGYTGIYVIPVREDAVRVRGGYEEYHSKDSVPMVPMAPMAPCLVPIAGVKTMSHPDPDSNMHLFILYTREGFVDAGEIFMGECDRETELLAGLVQKVGKERNRH